MLGAIIGDIVGSVYEFNNYRAKDFTPFFHRRAFYTDDTVCTIAVADALINERHPGKSPEGLGPTLLGKRRLGRTIRSLAWVLEPGTLRQLRQRRGDARGAGRPAGGFDRRSGRIVRQGDRRHP